MPLQGVQRKKGHFTLIFSVHFQAMLHLNRQLKNWLYFYSLMKPLVLLFSLNTQPENDRCTSHVAPESLVEKLVIFLFSNETIGPAFFL